MVDSAQDLFGLDVCKEFAMQGRGVRIPIGHPPVVFATPTNTELAESVVPSVAKINEKNKIEMKNENGK